MTNKQRFNAALDLKQPDYVPTFELVFFLTMELLRKIHPTHRHFRQWDQMSNDEQALQVRDAADVYVAVARAFDHSAIFVHSISGMPESIARIAEGIRNQTGDEYFLMCHGDSTLSVPNGDRMVEFSYRVADEPQGILDEQKAALEDRLAFADSMKSRGLLDGFALCADYCFNTNPFFSPDQFAVFVAPFLTDLISGYREMGYRVIKHTDGNIMPIIDQLVAAQPHALHSLDPQAGVDIAKIKKRYGSQICLIGNVNCGLLQTGTDDEVVESAEYAMNNGKPGGGYVFSTSNCVYTGMKLSRYKLMLDVWRRKRQY